MDRLYIIGFVMVIGINTNAAQAQSAGELHTFFRDGGWSGEVKAIAWGELDTRNAWAVGQHSNATAERACSARDGQDRIDCVQELMGQEQIRIFANCVGGVAWQAGDETRYGLTSSARAGKLKPLEDEAAWDRQMSHRARWTVASWLGFLCPGSRKIWRIGESK